MMYHHHHQKNPTYETTNSDPNHENSYSTWYNHHQESDDSGAASPHPLLRRHMSPESRAAAIVRGQWELMEMVRNMPESSYELSLKDIVEHNRVVQSIDHQTVLESEDDKNRSDLHHRAVVKRDDQSKKVERNLSFENKGLFLNMVFPFSFKAKKKNINKNKNSVVKVSPKPEGLRSERDWWKKKFTGSSDSDSSRTSSSSAAVGGGGRGGDVGGRKRNGLLSVCWPFFHSRSTKSAE